MNVELFIYNPVVILGFLIFCLGLLLYHPVLLINFWMEIYEDITPKVRRILRKVAKVLFVISGVVIALGILLTLMGRVTKEDAPQSYSVTIF